MKIYTFEVVIREGTEDFWDELREQNSTGADDVRQQLEDLIEQVGFFDADVKLLRYEDH